MFWQFDTGFISQIDTLLDKESVTLVELMEEEDILQECKSQNQKLIQFLIRPLILEEMINMITNEPPIDLNERIRYKYANIACEIMTSDVNAISDALVSDESMLNKLYNFIDTDKQLNPLLASFFSKVMGLLFIKKTEFVFEFFKTKDLISLLLSHIETSAIMDLILRLIISVDNLELRNKIVKWLFDNDLINKLIEIFKTKTSAQRHMNAAQLICDIIKTSREHQTLLQDKIDGDLLLDSLESTDTVSHLLENIFVCRTESCLVSGISVLQSLIEYKRHCHNINNLQQLPTPQNNIQQSSEFERMPQCYAQQMLGRSDMMGGPDQVTALDTERLAKSVRQVQAAILPRLDHFTSLLINPPQRDPIRTTIGTISPPLGATRLEVAHLITALLSCNNIEITEKLSELNTLPVLINLFFDYPWNNFLHKHVEQSINCILNNCKISSNNSPVIQENLTEQQLSQINKSTALLIVLLTKCQLIERIIDAFSFKSEANEESNAKQTPAGYYGHLVIIANNIVEKCEQHILQQNLTQEIYDKWIKFIEQVLSEINKQICTPLVSEMPNSVNLDEETLRQQENALQQAFIEYQMQQMTKSLCTQIAFAANEFAEVNENIPNKIDQLTKVNFNFENQLNEKDKSIEFERICSEKGKASLESNSSDDEDLWEDREITFNQSDTFDFNNTNNQINRFSSMDVDQNDPWPSDTGNICSVAPIPMDTSNPWENTTGKTQFPETISTTSTIEPDSWADFSSFPPTNESNSSVTNTPNYHSVTTTSSIANTFEVTPIDSNDAPESTTCDDGLISDVDSSSTSDIAISEAHCSGVVNNFQKSVSDDQENVVTSSTSDALQNGPNSLNSS